MSPALAERVVEAAAGAVQEALALSSRERWARYDLEHGHLGHPRVLGELPRAQVGHHVGFVHEGQLRFGTIVGTQQRMGPDVHVVDTDEGDTAHVEIGSRLYRAKPGAVPARSGEWYALREAAERAVVEALSSRERWARWELSHGHSAAGEAARREVERASHGTGAASLEHVDRLGLNEWPKPGAHAERILQGHKDTESLHTDAHGRYSRERQALHDRIAAHFLHGHQPQRQPRALFMAGGAASGKTTALKQSPHLAPHDAVEVNPDAVKEMLPEYQAMAKHGERYAAAGVHEESSAIAKRIMEEAQKRRLNVLVDGTGDSKRGKFAGKLEKAHKAGYHVHALYVTVPTDHAVDRSIRRAQRTGRHVPVPEIRNQHRNVSAFFPDVAALPFVKSVEVHDTSGPAPVKLASAKDGKLTVHDEVGYRRFLAKAREKA